MERRHDVPERQWRRLHVLSGSRAKGLPWPSVRAEIVRDGFEDYELLHLLRAKYAGKPNAEVDKILSCGDIIYSTKNYNETGDMDYIRLHRRLLELLAK